MRRAEGLGGHGRAKALTVPGCGGPIVRRPRLEAALDAGEGAGVTIVYGPPGVGKTSLLSGWAHGRALSRGSGTVRWLTPGPHDSPAEVVARLPTRRHQQRTLVVVDPVDDEDLVGALVDAVSGRRAHLRLVVGVEQQRLSLPPWARDLSTVLGPDVLLFDPAEAEALLRARCPAVTGPDLALIQRQCEGWASALVSLPRTIIRSPTYRAGAREAHEPRLDVSVLNTVAAPFVDSLPAAERELLLSVAHRDLVDREDLIGLTGSLEAVDRLGDAADLGGLVTAPAGSSDGPWRLHPVLRRCLSHRTPADRALAVLAHRRALRYFGARGERVRAVQHATAGSDPETIVDALVEHGPSLVAELREDVVDDALAALPDDVAERDPWLVAVRALRHRISGSVTAGLRDAASLTRLDNAVPRDRTVRPGHARHLADRAVLRLWEARYGLVDPHAAVSAATAALGAVDDGTELSVARRSWLSFELGAVNLWLGDVPQAALWTERGMTLAELDGSPRLAAAALAHRSVVEVVDGAYAAAGESAHTSLGIAASSRLLRDSYAARAHVAAAWASFSRLDPDLAWDHLVSLGQRPPSELDPAVLTLSRVVRGRLLTQRGEHEAAWGVLCGVPLRRADLPPQLRRLVAIARAELAVARRDVSAAHHESQMLDDLGHRAEAALLAAVAALVAGDVPGASTLLDGLLRTPSTPAVTGAAAAGCQVRLALAAGANDTARPLVLDLLSRVASGAADALPVIAAGDGALVDVLAAEASLPGGHPHAATALERLQRLRRRRDTDVAGGDGARARHARDSPGRSLLTARETAVLRCLGEGMSYEEIGHTLFITANTVKTHVRSVYRKLDVDRAGQAVRRARELGLLPS